MKKTRIRLEEFYISKDHDFRGHHGKPRGHNEILSPEKIQCVGGQGIVSDRYFGFKENFKGQITFFDHAVYERLKKAFSHKTFDPSVFRRNVLVSGIDLNSLIGRYFNVGGLRFYGTEECRPCYWMDEAIDKGAEEMLKGFGGLRCRILNDGTLEKGKDYKLSSVSADEELTLSLYAFSLAAQEVGDKENIITYLPSESPSDIIDRMQVLSADYQSRFRVALDEDFCAWDRECGLVEQMAIIPPVSGG